VSHLKSLTFSVAPQKAAQNPKLVRRQNLIDRLEDQRRLLKDPEYLPITKRWKRSPDGTKVLTEHSRRIKPWWQYDAAGSVVFSVRSGFDALEFEKGKSAIVVGSVDRLDGVIGTVISAVRAGELDGMIEAAKMAHGSVAGRQKKPIAEKKAAA
jgi:hypothetical protein